jgi:hypothetical protein
MLSLPSIAAVECLVQSSHMFLVLFLFVFVFTGLVAAVAMGGSHGAMI